MFIKIFLTIEKQKLLASAKFNGKNLGFYIYLRKGEYPLQKIYSGSVRYGSVNRSVPFKCAISTRFGSDRYGTVWIEDFLRAKLEYQNRANMHSCFCSQLVFSVIYFVTFFHFFHTHTQVVCFFSLLHTQIIFLFNMLLEHDFRSHDTF